MLDLGTTDFYIAVRSLPRQELEQYSTSLFDEWAEFVEQTLSLPDYSLSLEVEEGSVDGKAKIRSTALAVVVGVTAWGGFFQGIDVIRGQLSTAGDFLVKRAGAPFAEKGVKPQVRKHGGSLVRIQRLLVKVQRGEITPEQAMLEVEILLGEEDAANARFLKEMENALKQAPLYGIPPISRTHR